MAGNWCTIESDPGVFSELVRTIGVSGVQVEEHYTLDIDDFARHDHVHGIVFLFKYQGDSASKPIQHHVDGLFFAKQVIQNACAVVQLIDYPTAHAAAQTQALLSILLNCPSIDLGDELQNFKDFTLGMDSETLGLAISNQEMVRVAHNSFSRQETFTMEGPGGDDDAFHFISYVPFQGRLYELDGLQAGPIDHGPCGEDWMPQCLSVIQERMAKYELAEIRFNLMALVEDKLAHAEERKTLIQAQLMSLAEDAPEVNDLKAKEAECDQIISQETTKREKFRVENLRRRHNYIPLFVGLLRALAKKGTLKDLLATAKTKATERRAEAMAEQAKKGNAQ